MTSKRSCVLHIDKMLDSVNNSDPRKADLNLALQSVGKRSQFANLHFHQLFKYTGEDNLALERAGIVFTDGGDVSPHRTHYEANTFALAQNLHAACDSYPVALSLILGDLMHKGKALKQGKIGWNEGTYAALVSTFPHHKTVHRHFLGFANDPDFLLLKGLVNQTKHKFLVRILNLGSCIVFETIRYFPQAWNGVPRRGKVHGQTDGEGMASKENLGVEDFMRRCHNKLFPKLFILFWRLHEAKLRDVQSALQVRTAPIEQH